jgi:thiol-disulfide isomerase/thioredoxin
VKIIVISEIITEDGIGHTCRLTIHLLYSIIIKMRLIFNMPTDITSEKIRLLKTQYGKRTIVVLVHAEWCGHCTAFRPHWNQFCAKSPELLLVEVEVDTIESLAAFDPEAFSLLARDVRGFPTVFMYRTGVRPARVPFDKQRSVDGLKEFVGETKRPASAPVAAKKPTPAKKPTASAPAKKSTSAKPAKKQAPASSFSSPKSPKSVPRKKSI